MLALSYRLLTVAGLVAALLAPGQFALAAGDKAPAATQAATAPADVDIAKEIRQLNADRFADRQAASERLEAAGKPAIGALEKAALGESLEVTTRAIKLLQKFGQSSDAPTAQAAREALERLAKSDGQAASQSREALKELQPAQAQGEGLIVGPGMIIVGGGPGLVGNITVQVGAVQIGGGAAMTRISVSNVNGVKNVDVDDNGRKIKISDDPQKGIKMEVTAQKDGKEVTDKYEAKNADELKTKFPEAHKLYKQYAEGGGNAGGFRIRAAGNAVQLGGGPAATQPAGGAGAAAIPAGVGAGAVPIEITTAMMKNLAQQLAALSKGGQLKDAPAAEKANLKKQAEHLKRQIADLEKQLENTPPAEMEKK